MARLNELRLMIETRRLYNRGIGLTDAQLIASILIDAPTLLWTRDTRLRSVAENLGIHAPVGVNARSKREAQPSGAEARVIFGTLMRR